MNLIPGAIHEVRITRSDREKRRRGSGGTREVLTRGRRLHATPERSVILVVLAERGALFPGEIATTLHEGALLKKEWKPNAVRQLLLAMRKSGQVVRGEDGRYRITAHIDGQR